MTCCAVGKSAFGTRPACPRCGRVGRAVGDQTIKAILKAGVGVSLLALERRFCATPQCQVLYYGADGRVVDKGEAAVRVGLKETEDPIVLCYCFGFTRADVWREIAARGLCTIPSQIAHELKAGRCACEVKNPSGSCCVGEVRQAIDEALAGRAAPIAGMVGARAPEGASR